MFKELVPVLRDRAVPLTVTLLEEDQIRVDLVPKRLKDGDNDALTKDGRYDYHTDPEGRRIRQGCTAEGTRSLRFLERHRGDDTSGDRLGCAGRLR